MVLDENVALARHTTIGTGGPARWFARPETVDQLHELLSWADEHGVAVEVVGLGSNVLVHDAGVDALVLKLTAELASARVEGAKAAFNAAKQKVAKTTLTAPIAGKVALQYAKAGTQITEGSPVVRIISSDELFVKFAIPTQQVDTMAVNAKIDVQIESHGKQYSAQGIVKSVAPELDPVARMILAEAELVGELPSQLQAGLVCRVRPLATKK